MYQRYPLVMHHPAYKAARKISDARPAVPPAPGRPLIQAVPEQWEPEKWAPVTVQNEDQEAQHTAKGYLAAGNPNPQAFEKAFANPHVPGRVDSEYPKMVDGVLVQDPNAVDPNAIQEYPKWLTPSQGDSILVHSAEEEARYLDIQTAPARPSDAQLLQSALDAARGNPQQDESDDSKAKRAKSGKAA